MRVLSLALALIGLSLPAAADTVTGTVLAYDRVANLIVLDDKTVWSLETLKTAPEGLAAGAVVVIDFTSNGDSGLGRINALTLKD